MKQSFISDHFSDDEGRPEGGQSYGTGFTIAWQRGPLGNGITRVEANGAFVETIIDVAVDRLNFYQRSQFNCAENDEAIRHLEAALRILNARTERRVLAGVEGTHEGN
jgi:hypothetical protein